MLLSATEYAQRVNAKREDPMLFFAELGLVLEDVVTSIPDELSTIPDEPDKLRRLREVEDLWYEILRLLGADHERFRECFVDAASEFFSDTPTPISGIEHMLDKSKQRPTAS